MNNISFDDFKKSNMYPRFLSENSSLGYVKIQASAAREAVPLEGVSIVIYKVIGNYKVIFYRGVTDSSGVIDDIILPSPKTVLLSNLEIPDYTTYQLDASLEGFNPINGYVLSVFDKIKNIQDVVLQPIINI